MNAAEDILVQADAAIGEARALRTELDDNVGRGRAICRRAQMHAVFQSELSPAMAISLLVLERSANAKGR
jgi:hypothetical protein